MHVFLPKWEPMQMPFSTSLLRNLTVSIWPSSVQCFYPIGFPQGPLALHVISRCSLSIKYPWSHSLFLCFLLDRSCSFFAQLVSPFCTTVKCYNQQTLTTMRLPTTHLDAHCHAHMPKILPIYGLQENKCALVVDHFLDHASMYRLLMHPSQTINKLVGVITYPKAWMLEYIYVL